VCEAYHHDDGESPFHSATERVVQMHFAQTLTGHLRCYGALIRLGNVHPDLRLGADLIWCADESSTWSGDRSLESVFWKRHQLPCASIWIPFVRAFNNQVITLVLYRLNALVLDGAPTSVWRGNIVGLQAVGETRSQTLAS